jgi:hypothetical protein
VYGPRRDAQPPTRFADTRDDALMAGLVRPRSLARVVLVVSMAVVALGAMATASDTTAAGFPRWTGGIDLYRSGTFTTQQTWLWCTAADTQIIRNIADHATDHSRSSQQRYFDYMRAHDRYAIPVSDGVDPGGWTAGLRHFVDGRYRLVVSRSFDSALRSAVTNLRRTDLPVGITVSHGNHAWILTGFTATADPATTTHFTVTSVRVVGPLWGLQSRTYGYDMRPDTRLTPSQLKGFFTPWHYARIKMAWEGRWVSIQPIATTASTPIVKPKTTPRPPATGRPAATVPPSASPSVPGSPSPQPPVTSPSSAPAAGVAAVDASAPPRSDPPDPAVAAAVTTTQPDETAVVGIVAGLAVLVATIGLLGIRALRTGRRR